MKFMQSEIFHDHAIASIVLNQKVAINSVETVKNVLRIQVKNIYWVEFADWNTPPDDDNIICSGNDNVNI